jgi:uncharacterized protein YkwD
MIEGTSVIISYHYKLLSGALYLRAKFVIFLKTTQESPMMYNFPKTIVCILSTCLFAGIFQNVCGAVPVYTEIPAECSVDNPGNDAVPLSTLAARALKDGWNLETLDTARHVDYQTAAEKDVVLALNMVRTNPARYAQLYISEVIATYRGKLRNCSNGRLVRTIEGDVPARQLYDELMRKASTPKLTPVFGMHHVADQLALEQSMTGRTGHITQDGNNLQFRIDSHGQWRQTIGETIDYGGMTGFDAINNLLIDDGVSNRSHRLAMFEPTFHVVGVSIRRHPVYGTVTVVDYADSFTENRATSRAQK